MEPSGVLSTIQFAHRKGPGTSATPFCVSHTLQSALESVEDKIVQIDFSVPFDRVKHQGILNKLCSVGIRGSVKVKSSMARSLPVENLLPQKVGSIINYFQ